MSTKDAVDALEKTLGMPIEKIIEFKNIINDLGGVMESNPDVAGPWVVGDAYYIRTVTQHLTGRIARITAQEIVLSEAAWIPESGPFTGALMSGEFKRVEPFPDDQNVIVGRNSVVDAMGWPHKLPRAVVAAPA